MDQAGDSFGSIALHRWRDVGVDLTGDGRAAVVQAFADDLDVDARSQRQRRPRVAEAMQRDRRELIAGMVAVEVLPVAVELA